MSSMNRLFANVDIKHKLIKTKWSAVSDSIRRNSMILVADVGNTNITFGVYESSRTPVSFADNLPLGTRGHQKNLITTFRLMAKTQRTSDEYGVLITELLSKNHVQTKEIEGAIIASVVPNVMHALTGGIKRYVVKKLMTVGAGIKTGIKIVTENPKEIGPDRIVDAVAAYELYGGPVLVLDFGTATTYDLVDENGCFCAGITAPGIRISAKALWEDAAKLPEIEIKKPASILAQETISSMQAGLVYGQIGQTEYIVNRVRKETGYENLKVVATGGLGRIIAEETDVIQEYNSALTLEGLRIIYEKNNR